MKKLNAYVITITTFIFWTLFEFLKNHLKMETNIFLTAFVASVFSYTTYKTVVSVLMFFGKHSETIKKIILNNKYLNGKWIGYYHSSVGVMYFVETIEQEIDSITIRGYSFNGNFEPHAEWISQAVDLDGEKGIITFTYLVSDHDGSGDGLGMSQYHFVRDKSHSIYIQNSSNNKFGGTALL